LNPIKSVAFHLLLPASIIAAFFVLLYFRGQIPELFWSATTTLFYSSSFIAIGVSWHYNRSRFIFILLPLIILFWALNTLNHTRSELLLILVPLIIPLHMLLFLFFKERGLFSFWGALKTGFVFLEVVAVYYIINRFPDMISVVNVSLFQDYLTSWTQLADLSLLITIVFFFIFILLAFLHFQVIYHTAFSGLYLLVMIGMHYSSHESYMALAFFGATLIVIGILLKESYRLAFYDELTALPGRRALIEDMAKLGRKYSLAMVDIDHFKKFNDSYGHDTGDDVLKMVAASLSKVEGGGRAYRYGGEEFTVLFPSKDVDNAYGSMERVRQDIASASFTVRYAKSTKKAKPRRVSIHISAGVVEKEGKDKNPLDVMKRADNALYKAKKSGRNKVVKVNA